MVLEAKLQDRGLIMKNEAKEMEQLELQKLLDNLKKEVNDCFVKLDRLLYILQEKEEKFDFPVAFATNILYVCQKNGNSSLLHDPMKFGE